MTTDSRPSPLALFNVTLVGLLLGVIFVKSEVARWERIHDMFLFREPRMFLIIATAILVAGVSMRVLKKLGAKSFDGKPISYDPKPFQYGVIFGGLCFGAGWAITGACPGPIYAQMGAGEFMAIFTFLGGLAGMLAYAALKPKLPH